jgi:hypothetical protein
MAVHPSVEPLESRDLLAVPSGFGALVQVTSLTPFTNTGDITGQSGTVYLNSEVEPNVAVDPRDPTHLVGLWQQDRWSNGASRGIVAGVSLDGGTTWSQVPIPGATVNSSPAGSGAALRASDPWVSIGPDGTVYAAYLESDDPTLHTPRGMFVSTSSDGGFHWNAPVAVIVNNDNNLFNDKETVTADPVIAGTAYLVWDRLDFSGNRGPSLFSRTTDGGQTWSAPQVILDPTNGQTLSNQIVVLPSGVLVNMCITIDYATNHVDVVVLRSFDHGATWSSPITVSSLNSNGITDPDTGATVRTGSDIPQIAVDHQSGNLYIVWQDNRFSGGAHDDVVFSMSADGGLTWSAPIKINQTPTNIPSGDQQAFTPMVAVAADGTVAVSYYDFRNNTAAAGLSTDAWIVFGNPAQAPGGFGHEQRLTNTPFDMELAPVANGEFVGDYEGLVAGGSSFDTFGALFAQAVSTTDPTSLFFRGSLPPKGLHPILVTGADAGGGPEVKVFDAVSHRLELDFYAYDRRFTGGVRVAAADVNGDGIPDIITAPGPGGGPDIRVFDGTTGALIREFMAYDARFSGGVFVAAADLNGDGHADIIVGPGRDSGPEVKAFDGQTGLILADFFAYSPFFSGGVTVAAGDVEGTGLADIITGPGAGGGPDVRIFNISGTLVNQFSAYDPKFSGGVFVATGVISGSGAADIITAPGAGGGPDIRIFTANAALIDEFMAGLDQATLFNDDNPFRAGVRVATFVSPSSGRAQIITGFGPPSKPLVEIFDPFQQNALASLVPYDPAFLGGVFVGGA